MEGDEDRKKHRQNQEREVLNMTNYEANKETIELITLASGNWGANSDNEVFRCHGGINSECVRCQFNRGDAYAERACVTHKLNWLKEEHSNVDWSKVETDTLILVSNDGNTWAYRYFAGTFFGRLYTFPFDNKSDNERQMNLIEWKFGKLIEEEEDDWD